MFGLGLGSEKARRHFGRHTSSSTHNRQHTARSAHLSERQNSIQARHKRAPQSSRPRAHRGEARAWGGNHARAMGVTLRWLEERIELHLVCV